MNISTQIEQKSAEQLLNNLGLAIDEARHVRSTIKSNTLASKPETHGSVSRRLKLVNREIELLETKLIKVRCLAISA